MSSLKDVENELTDILHMVKEMQRENPLLNPKQSALIQEMRDLLQWARGCVPYPSACHTAIAAQLDALDKDQSLL